jgi:serine/threonine protein kinase
VKPSHFDFLKTIGQGSFGRVYLVRYHTDQKVYAMKVLGKEHIKMRNEVKHVMAERNVLLSNINHPFLVSLHYSFQTKDKLYFVLDFLNGGELFFHLQRERCFSESRARFYAAEVASALGYLHEVLDGLELDLARRRTWAICASSQYQPLPEGHHLSGLETGEYAPGPIRARGSH